MARYEDGREVPIRDLWRADSCPAPLLPWLAWALAVVRWNPDWDVLVHRQVVRDALPLHRIEGTRAAVERMLADLGVQHAPIVENPGGRRFTASLAIRNSDALPDLDVAAVRSYLEEVGRLSVEWTITLAAGLAPVRVGVGAAFGGAATVAAVRVPVDVP